MPLFHEYIKSYIFIRCLIGTNKIGMKAGQSENRPNCKKAYDNYDDGSWTQFYCVQYSIVWSFANH